MNARTRWNRPYGPGSHDRKKNGLMRPRRYNHQEHPTGLRKGTGSLWTRKRPGHANGQERAGEPMRLAIALEGEEVSGHFGHCEKYALFQVMEGRADREKDVLSPGHEPGKLPVFLADLQVDMVIAGGMGPKAVELFQQRGIDVLLGVKGNASQVAETFAAGRLQPGISSCHH